MTSNPANFIVVPSQAESKKGNTPAEVSDAELHAEARIFSQNLIRPYEF
jgi:hypothetical protein